VVITSRTRMALRWRKQASRGLDRCADCVHGVSVSLRRVANRNSTATFGSWLSFQRIGAEPRYSHLACLSLGFPAQSITERNAWLDPYRGRVLAEDAASSVPAQAELHLASYDRIQTQLASALVDEADGRQCVIADVKVDILGRFRFTSGAIGSIGHGGGGFLCFALWVRNAFVSPEPDHTSHNLSDLPSGCPSTPSAPLINEHNTNARGTPGMDVHEDFREHRWSSGCCAVPG